MECARCAARIDLSTKDLIDAHRFFKSGFVVVCAPCSQVGEVCFQRSPNELANAPSS